MMKRIGCLILCCLLLFSLSACGTSYGDSIQPGKYASTVESVDYQTAKEFETALNNGEDTIGKTVTFAVQDVKPDSSLGFNLWAGEHLNFVSNDSVDVAKGDTISVRVLSVSKNLGSWVINYELIDVSNEDLSDESTSFNASSSTTKDSSNQTEKKKDEVDVLVSSTPHSPAINNSKPASTKSVPTYSNKAYVAINNNIPSFSASEKTTTSYEYYSNLDKLDRCGVAVACIGRDLMPTTERGSIGSIKPTGWHTVKYDNVDGKYLYNRCHLIGYQLSGENANTKNLITGTRYLNVIGMLPFENMVADYVKETGNHVMYRVTPIFDGNNLLASGVQMEAFSVEDNGDGICFNVYCYNVQPGININYATGDSSSTSGAASESSSKQQPSSSPVVTAPTNPQSNTYILNTNTKKFHYPSCSAINTMKDSNKREYSGSRNDLISQGYEPCKRCNP